MPTFAAILIDGDIECSCNKPPKDEKGIIRVQPGTSRTKNKSGSQHRGIVLQFKKKKKGTFDYFAVDLREQISLANNMKKIS